MHKLKQKKMNGKEKKIIQ